MVESWHADVAVATMFTASWLNETTCGADLVLFKEDSVVLVVHETIDVLPGDDPWRLFAGSDE